MFKSIIVVIILNYLLLSCATTNKSTIAATEIAWAENKPIQFNNFMGVKPIESKYAAFISSYINIKPYDSANYTIKAVMRCNLSYTITSDKYILKHEQYHFDITELFARMLRKQIIEEQIKIPSSKYYYCYAEQLNKYLNFQANYDSITQHSKNKAQQLLWQKNIDAQLAALEQYKNPIIAK